MGKGDGVGRAQIWVMSQWKQWLQAQKKDCTESVGPHLSRDFIHYFFGCLWSFLMPSFMEYRLELIQPLDSVV